MKFFHLVLANLGRHKRRTFLTIASVALALFLFASLQTVVTTVERASQFGGARRLVMTNASGFILPLPLSYANRLSATKGVTNVTWANWFGGKYGDNKTFFAQFAGIPTHFHAAKRTGVIIRGGIIDPDSSGSDFFKKALGQPGVIGSDDRA